MKPGIGKLSKYQQLTRSITTSIGNNLYVSKLIYDGNQAFQAGLKPEFKNWIKKKMK
jgi:hypothetical protein